MNRNQFYKLLENTSLDGGFPAIDLEHHPNGGKPLRKCRYRTKKGKKCPVGWLIPDKNYVVTMEDMLITEIPAHYVQIPEGMTITELRELQTDHDILAQNSGPWDHEAFMKSITKTKVRYNKE